MSASGQIRAGGAYVEIVADDRKLRKGLQKAQTRMRGFSETVKAIGADLLSVTAIGGSAFALPLRSFAKFDDQIRTTAAISRASTREIDALRNSARQLGATTAFTAQQVAEGQTSLARMGMSARNIKGAMKPLLDLVRATGNGTETLGQASLAVGTILRSFNLRDSADSVRDVVDTLTAASNMSATDLWSFMESLKLVGPVARDAGADLRDVASQLMILADSGLRGTEAGTALRRAYVALTKDGGKKFQELGVSVIRSNGSLRSMQEILIDLGEALRQMPNAQRLEKLRDIFDIRGMTGVSNLLNGLNRLASTRGRLNGVNGLAMRTAAEQERGIGGQLRLLVAAVEEFNLALGEAFSQNGGKGMIAQFAEAVRTLAKVFKEFGPAIGLLGRLGAYMLVFKTGASLLRGFSDLLAPATKRIDSMFFAFTRLAKGADISAGAIRNNQRFLRERNNDLAKLNELEARSLEADKAYRAALDNRMARSRAVRAAKTQYTASYHALGAFVPRSQADAVRAMNADPVNQSKFREMMDASNNIRRQIDEERKALAELTGIRETAHNLAVRRNRLGKIVRGARMRNFGTRVFAMEDLRAERVAASSADDSARAARAVARDFAAPENMIEDQWYREAKADADQKARVARNLNRQRARHLREIQRKVARSGQTATGAWERYYDTSMATEGAERRFEAAGGQQAIDQQYQKLDRLQKQLQHANRRLFEARRKATSTEWANMQREDAAALRSLEKQRASALKQYELVRKELDAATAAGQGARAGKIAANAAAAAQRAYVEQTPFQREMQYWKDRETLVNYQTASGGKKIAMQNEYNQALARTGMVMTDVGKATRQVGVVTEGAMLRAQKGRTMLAQINAANMGFIKTLRRRFQVYQSLSIQELAMARHGVTASNARRMAFLAEAAAIKGVGKGVSWLGAAMAPLLSPTNILLMGIAAAWWAINSAIEAHNKRIREAIAKREKYAEGLGEITRKIEDAQSRSSDARQWLVRARSEIIQRGGRLDNTSRPHAESAIKDLYASRVISAQQADDLKKYFGLDAGFSEDVASRVNALFENLLNDSAFNNAKFVNAEITGVVKSKQDELANARAELAGYQKIIVENEKKIIDSFVKYGTRTSKSEENVIRRNMLDDFKNQTWETRARATDPYTTVPLFTDDEIARIAELQKKIKQFEGDIESVSRRRSAPSGAFDSEKAARIAAQEAARKSYVDAMGVWGDAGLKDDPRARLAKLSEALGSFQKIFRENRQYMSGEQGADLSRLKMLTAQAQQDYQRQLRKEFADRQRNDKMNELLGASTMPQFAEGVKLINAEIAKARQDMEDAKSRLNGAAMVGDSKEVARQQERQERATSRYYDLIKQRNDAVRGFMQNAPMPGTFGDFSAAAAIAGAVGQVTTQERIAISTEEMKKYLQTIYQYYTGGGKVLLMGR